MVGKKSIKIFAACAAAVAIVVGVSVGITQGNESRSTNANFGKVAEDISMYECVESTVSGGGKSGKSGVGRRMIVPGTEDYLRVKVPANQRRRLASELLRFRGMEFRKLGKESFVIENTTETIACGGHGVGCSGDGLGTSGCAGAGCSGDGAGSSGDGLGASEDGMGEAQGSNSGGSNSGGSKSGKGAAMQSSKGSKGGSGSSKGGKSSSVKECAPVESLCDAFTAGAKGGKTGGKSGKSTGGKSGKAEPVSVETDNVGTGKASKAPTMSCIPTEVVEVITANPTVTTTPAPIEAAITPAPVPETPAPVTPMPLTPAPVTPMPLTPAPVTPMPQTPAPVTPMPQTPAPVTPEVVTFAPTLLITPEPTPFSTEGASVGSTPTVGTEATSLPVSSDPRLLPT